MKQIEKHPAPEKLLQQITEEAINALALGGPDKIGDEAPMEAGVKLIAKAWGVPRESLQASLELIERERQLLRSGSSEDALPNSELLKPYDGKMIAELLWGLFETTARLEDAQDRAAMHKLALLMAESLNLDSWIAECGLSKPYDGSIQEGLSLDSPSPLRQRRTVYFRWSGKAALTQGEANCRRQRNI